MDELYAPVDSIREAAYGLVPISGQRVIGRSLVYAYTRIAMEGEETLAGRRLRQGTHEVRYLLDAGKALARRHRGFGS